MRLKKYVIGLVLTAATLAALAALLWTPILSSDRNASGPVDLIAELHARFDPKRPGFGAADYPGNAAVHIPKSYAAILLAEVERSRGGLRPDLPNLAIPAGTWLLDHANLDGDGHPGWGVPIAWDAYGDGSINPANTAYTISTAIVVDALLAWMERDSSSPQKRIFETVTNALKPFADKQYRSPSGLLPYSFRKSDQPYDTFNPAAYMAGQLQRFSQLTPDQELATALRSAADDTVQVLLNEKKVNPATGSWYWLYSIQENVANDLPHASYIIDGLRTYIVHGGRLADQIDINAAFAHLKEFEDKSAHYVRGWPLFQQNIDRPARTYDLGMAMSIACTTPETAPIADVFLAELPKYRDNRNGYLKYPKGSEYAPPLIVNEYEAYLYRGAIDCRLLAERKRSASFAIDFAPIDAAPHPSLPKAVPAAARTTRVPFVHPSKTSASNVRYNQDTSTFTLEDANSTSITFDQSLPITDHLIEGRRAIFTRHLGTNRLSLVITSKTGDRISELQIKHSDGSEPIFRASTIAADQLILVYYDNITLNNYLVQYRIDQDGAHPQRPPLRLPLLQDPAGGTYEMIPPVFLLQIDSRQLAVVGGTLVGTLSLPDGSLSVRRIDNCLRAVEAVSSTDGAVVLCQKRQTEETEAAFFVDAPPSLKTPRYEPDQLPYNLRVQDGSIVSEFATDGEQLQAMLRFDLERSQQNGWMEFGTNNDEGRIPWSQIYYLNGMLDFLRLSAISSQPLASADLLSNIRTRLDLEMKLVDQYWRDTRIATRGFTVDRSPAVFAVQTSRLLLLMKRYQSELNQPEALQSLASLETAVHCLDNHIDVLRFGGEPAHWMKPGNAHLRWPYGSAFYFDGLAVPYNHQNEWAYAIARSEQPSTCKGTKSAGHQIVDHFMRHVAPSGVFPNSGRWDYWWGTAYDGWAAQDNVSTNKPSYPGDKIKAWISFRTIDLMSALANIEQFDPMTRSNLLISARHQIYTGKVYPFANYELMRAGTSPLLATSVARQYIRVTSPWELQNAAWAYLTLLRGSNDSR